MLLWEREGIAKYQVSKFETLASLGSNCSFQGKQLLLARGSLVGKFKCWPLSETIEKRAKSIQVVSWHLSWQGDPRQRRGSLPLVC